MSFDDIIPRVNTNSVKWDMMEALYGVSPSDGLAMWVADMDFATAECVQTAVTEYATQGIFGYFGNDASCRDAVCWWMRTRHNWDVDPDSILFTNGLVNAVGLCLQSFTSEGDGVVLTTPVYHAFARTIKAAGRDVVECELRNTSGKYEMDFDAWDAQMTGRETMFILCSPHNPGGRVWTRDELKGVAAFCLKHDLLLISDEVHHDLVFGDTPHIPMSTFREIADRLIVLTAPSKTFNVAGAQPGSAIIENPELRKKFFHTQKALGLSASAFALQITRAAYTPEGAAWVDQLVAYLDENRRIFDEAIAAIPGLSSMALQATYLAWVDFSGTGMDVADYRARVLETAKIAPNFGETFGKGGETYLRFNLATQRKNVVEACHRLKAAFADLQ